MGRRTWGCLRQSGRLALGDGDRATPRSVLGVAPRNRHGLSAGLGGLLLVQELLPSAGDHLSAVDHHQRLELGADLDRALLQVGSHAPKGLEDVLLGALTDGRRTRDLRDPPGLVLDVHELATSRGAVHPDLDLELPQHLSRLLARVGRPHELDHAGLALAELGGEVGDRAVLGRVGGVEPPAEEAAEQDRRDQEGRDPAPLAALDQDQAVLVGLVGVEVAVPGVAPRVRVDRQLVGRGHAGGVDERLVAAELETVLLVHDPRRLVLEARVDLVGLDALGAAAKKVFGLGVEADDTDPGVALHEGGGVGEGVTGVGHGCLSSRPEAVDVHDAPQGPPRTGVGSPGLTFRQQVDGGALGGTQTQVGAVRSIFRSPHAEHGGHPTVRHDERTGLEPLSEDPSGGFGVGTVHFCEFS